MTPTHTYCTCDGPTYEIRNGFGDLMSIVQHCVCPRPLCVICHRALDDDGRCTDMCCQHYGLPVPLPDVGAPIIDRPNPTRRTIW